MIGLAAKRGVDVRIITPGIPDKKIIYKLTRSYYARLVFDGVLHHHGNAEEGPEERRPQESGKGCQCST